ncbi:hypothetical protein A2U01_0048121, partial [Trifolium medium]|nr:hypothetical protein [Trifolium medium]
RRRLEASKTVPTDSGDSTLENAPAYFYDSAPVPSPSPTAVSSDPPANLRLPIALIPTLPCNEVWRAYDVLVCVFYYHNVCVIYIERNTDPHAEVY